MMHCINELLPEILKISGNNISCLRSESVYSMALSDLGIATLPTGFVVDTLPG